MPHYALDFKLRGHEKHSHEAGWRSEYIMKIGEKRRKNLALVRLLRIITTIPATPKPIRISLNMLTLTLI
jgi:hypothetical protein